MGIAVAHLACNLIGLHGSIFNQAFGLLNPLFGERLNKGLPCICLKNRTEVAGAHSQMGANGIQGDIRIPIIFLYIVLRHDSLLFAIAVLLVLKPLGQMQTEGDQILPDLRDMLFAVDGI